MKQANFKNPIVIIIIAIGLLLSIKITSMMILGAIGNSVYAKDQPDSARNYYQLLTTFNWFEPEIALANIGNTYFQQSKFQDARANYEQALSKSQPKYICPIAINLGNSIVRIQENIMRNQTTPLSKDAVIKELETAISYYDRCLKQEPNNEAAITNKALVLILIEQIKQAETSSQPTKPDDNSDAEARAKQQQQEDEKNQQESKKQRDYYNNQNRQPSSGNNW